jgi:hypothetical protein
MDEGRKRTILIAASILVSRRVAQMGPQSSPALEAANSDAVVMAEKVMQRIDSWFAPSPPSQSMDSASGYPWKSRT